MADIKKLVQRELDKSDKRYQQERSSSFAAQNVEAEDKAKAEKILTFAESVLHEFANQTGKKVRRIRNKDGYGWVDCMVKYEMYIPNILGFKKSDSRSLEITIGVLTNSGHRSGPPLKFGVSEYGRNVPISDINEEWLVKVLMEEYKQKVWR